MRFLAVLVTILGFGFQTSQGYAQQVVRVVGYTFPPFVVKEGAGGLTTEFLDFLNTQQSDFRFEFTKAPPNRRYWAFQEKHVDLILFEMPEWGWHEYKPLFDETRVLLRGGEVYITQAKEGRGQAYFDDIKGKHIVGVFGYHYGFAGFENDQQWLEKNFSIILTDDPKNVLTMVLKERADVGVVTQSYLSQYLAQNPDATKALLISKKKDQEYRLRALIGKHAPITIAQFEAMLEKLKKSDALKKFFNSKGLGNRLAF